VHQRRNNLVIIAFVVAALVGAFLLIVPGSPLYKKPVLGLDLQGGLQVVLKAVPEEGRPLRESDLDRSVEIIRERIDKIGVAEPEVRTQPPDQISVELPGVRDAARAQDLIGQTAKLELFDLQTALTGPSIDSQGFQPIANGSLFDLLAAAPTQQLARAEGGGPFYLFRAEGKKLLAGPLPTRAALLETEAAREAGVTAGTVPEAYRIFKVPNETAVVTCGTSAVVCPGVNAVNPTTTFYYLFKYVLDPDEQLDLMDRFPQMTGDDLRLQGTRQDFDASQGGQPIVLMSFTNAGEDKFEEITRAEAQRGRRLYNSFGGGQGDPDNFNQNFAIVLDKEIRSFPSIDFEQYPAGIGGSGGAQITGLEGLQEAKDLALVLQTGALPVEFQTLEESQISATLGEDSLRQALQASILGLILVAIFLLVVYRFLGVVAVFGLAIYAVFTYVTILVFNITLTLPGFAGMILAVGVAADANIVIFERIKEEARAGRSVRAAVSTGYTKGFATIIDANVVTAITAVILFVLATSGVRGFAFLLLLGTATSIVTAVFATRALLALLGGFRWFDNPAFMGASARQIPRWQRIDIVGKRRIWFSLAALSIVLSVTAIAWKGLNLGIDFRGGSQINFTTAQFVQLDDVRAEAQEIGREGAVIQGKGDAGPNESYRQFQIKTETLAPGEQRQLLNALEREFDTTSLGARNVSASFSEQILRSAIYAIIASFVLIAIYVTIRFEWRFAVPILRTIGNDGAIAVGVYAVSGREVTAATVAAFLTIIGYSIYDTIIIFDRVRENIPLMRRSTIGQIINQSLWETIPRSLATTFIVLLPVSALFFFGGETLKDFAFAILVGISVSAFSTIFIAAPFLAVLKEREPEYRTRLKEARAAGLPGAATMPAPAVAPTPDGKPVPDTAPGAPAAERARTDEAKRERRRQRRRARPHGRAR
jgi:SecD/SecF fusion protein